MVPWPKQHFDNFMMFYKLYLKFNDVSILIAFDAKKCSQLCFLFVKGKLMQIRGK